MTALSRLFLSDHFSGLASREAHPWATVLAGAAFFLLAGHSGSASVQLALLFAALLVPPLANVPVFALLRRVVRLVLAAIASLAAFLTLLLIARAYAAGRSVGSLGVADFMDDVAVPVLRLAAGTGSLLCIVGPLLAEGGLRRVLRLGLPLSASVLILATLSNLNAFKLATDRTLTAYYASGRFAHWPVFRKLVSIPGLIAGIWRSVVLWIPDAFDFKWTAHDVPGMAAAYHHNGRATYSALRTLAIVALVIACTFAPKDLG